MIKTRIQIDPAFCITVAIALFLLPIKWVLGWMFASAVHELAHYAALRMRKVDVYGVKVGPIGAVMSTGYMSNTDELIVAVAGPVGGILVAPFYRWIPSVSLCAIVQSLYNLLPMFPMDGGRIFAAIMTLLLGRRRGTNIAWWVGTLSAVGLIAVGFYLWYIMDYSLMVFVAFALIAVKSIGKHLENN